MPTKYIRFTNETLFSFRFTKIELCAQLDHLGKRLVKTINIGSAIGIIKKINIGLN